MTTIDSVRSRFSEAVTLRNDGKIEEALSLGQDLLKEDPTSSAITGFIGVIYYSDLDSPKHALPFFVKVVSLSPVSERASLGLFHSLWDTGEEEKAIVEVRRFLELMPESEIYDDIMSWLKDFYS